MLTQTEPLRSADEILVAHAVGNSAAFAELYDRYADRVYRYLLVRTGNVQDAQELTAETFLAAFQDIARYRGEGQFAAWLFGIARHQVAHYFRERRETADLDAAQELSHPQPPLDEHIAERLQMEQVRAALARLQPERAEALTLRVLVDLPAAEVARIMGKSESAVRMLAHRALRDLRIQLAEADEDKR